MKSKPIELDVIPKDWSKVNTLTGQVSEHKFETLAIYSPAAQIIKSQLDEGFDPKRVCISAVEYYEPLVQEQERKLEEYVKRYGTL